MKINKYNQASEIWMNFSDGLEGYIYKKTRDSKLAKEINYQVHMKVVNSCCSDIQIKNVRSWLFQIAHNTTIDQLKRRKRNTDLESDIQQESTESVYRDIEPFVSNLIDFLPEKYRVPLKLSDIEGMKQKDVADQLDLNLSATKSRIQRGRELLKQEILTCFHIQTDGENKLDSIVLKDSCKSLQAVTSKKAP